MFEELSLTNNINSKSPNGLKTIFKDHLIKCWINPKDKKEWELLDIKLDVIGEETLSADCDVTDHYGESNIAYQDQITLRPKTYTVSGEVGELVWYRNNPISQTVGQVAQKLEGVISFLPIRSKGFNQMKNTVMKASQWVDTASNALTKLSSLTSGVIGKFGNNEDIEGALTRQAQAYQWLLLYRDKRLPVNIRTPWGILNSYVITNLEFKQPRETKDKSFITITFKEFRTTSIQIVPFDANKFQGNAAFESQPISDLGKTDGENVSIGQKEYVVVNSEIAGDFEHAAIRVDVTDGQEMYNVYYGTGNRFGDSRFLLVDSAGKKVTDQAIQTGVIRAAKDTLSIQVDRASPLSATGDEPWF